MEYMSHQCSISAQPLRPGIFYRQRSPAGLKVRLRLAVLVACQLSSPVRLHPLWITPLLVLNGKLACCMGSETNGPYATIRTFARSARPITYNKLLDAL